MDWNSATTDILNFSLTGGVVVRVTVIELIATPARVSTPTTYLPAHQPAHPSMSPLRCLPLPFPAFPYLPLPSLPRLAHSAPRLTPLSLARRFSL
ncbi:hypothetical protein E2C01_038149 [Portunus trituberculatus]|uniref:Uncharacterized protein n=1 Tax=Portunus trituberculatus TaxID=210409 RepID=A0A5B7FGH5_PORTR|nr:hypothetical protein [Portunus trituberculatus]